MRQDRAKGERMDLDWRTIDRWLIGEAWTGSHPFRSGDPDQYVERLFRGEFDRSALEARASAEDKPVADRLRNFLTRLISSRPHGRYRTLDKAEAALAEVLA